jgi:hypothetical protein
MTENMMNTEKAANKSTEIFRTPTLIMSSGNTIYLIGLHYKEDAKETLEDKVKKLIRKDINESRI